MLCSESRCLDAELLLVKRKQMSIRVLGENIRALTPPAVFFFSFSGMQQTASIYRNCAMGVSLYKEATMPSYLPHPQYPPVKRFKLLPKKDTWNYFYQDQYKYPHTLHGTVKFLRFLYKK